MTTPDRVTTPRPARRRVFALGAALSIGATLAPALVPALGAPAGAVPLAAGVVTQARDGLAADAEAARAALGELRSTEAAVAIAAAVAGTGDTPVANDAVVTAQARFVALRQAVATEAAGRAGVDPAALDAAWAAAGDQRLTVVLTALAQVGDPYRRRAAGPNAFDCSGLTSFAWAAVGVTLPRNSSAQIRAAAAREADGLLPGDLVWRPGHVMLYLGVEDAIVHASRRGRPVAVDDWGRVRRFGSPV